MRYAYWLPISYIVLMVLHAFGLDYGNLMLRLLSPPYWSEDLFVLVPLEIMILSSFIFYALLGGAIDYWKYKRKRKMEAAAEQRKEDKVGL